MFLFPWRSSFFFLLIISLFFSLCSISIYSSFRYSRLVSASPSLFISLHLSLCLFLTLYLSPSLHPSLYFRVFFLFPTELIILCSVAASQLRGPLLLQFLQFPPHIPNTCQSVACLCYIAPRCE